MEKVYVALMDNGSGESIIHGIHATHEGALAQLQKDFLMGLDDLEEDDEELITSFEDPEHPTLEEMEDNLPGTGCDIVEVTLGTDIYVELTSGFDVDEILE